MSATPARVLDLLADDTDARHRNERAEVAALVGPSLTHDGAPPHGDADAPSGPEAERAAALVPPPWKVRDWLTMDAEPMLDCGWLIRGLWPADAYGIIAAESKAGKTWLALDLASLRPKNRGQFSTTPEKVESGTSAAASGPFSTLRASPGMTHGSAVYTS